MNSSGKPEGRKIKLTSQDLELIRSFAIEIRKSDMRPHSPYDDSQRITEAYAKAVSNWLRSKGILDIYLD